MRRLSVRFHRNSHQELIRAAEEALAQREGEIARAGALEQEKSELVEALKEKESLITSQNEEISRLQSVIDRQAAEIALLKPIPVVGMPDTFSSDTGSGAAIENGQPKPAAEICLVSQSWLKGRLITIMAVFMGVVVVGGGSLAVFRADAKRKFTVRMTREQLDDYIRYQRGRGK